MIYLKDFFHRIKCRLGHDDDEKCETCGIKYKYFEYFLDYKNIKDGLIEYKCLRSTKNYQHKFKRKVKRKLL